MYLLIVFVPLLTYVLSSLFARPLGAKGVAFLTVLGVAVTWMLSVFACYEVMLGGAVVTMDLFDWFVFEGFFVKWGFIFDSLTVSMLFIVTLVSALVHLYSIEYMKEDPHLSRFMTYLTLFTFFMILLVTSSNYLQLFMGWEGVGLVSYLLINFWHTRIQANKSALKAILVNRVGDFFFFFGIIITVLTFGAVNFEVVFTLTPYLANQTLNILGYEVSNISLIGLLFFLGAVGKSAQLGLHTWLPDAMEGPTPVSALIHAATMVTAGVFLLLRSAPLLNYSQTVLNIMIVVGALTAFLGASIGMFQTDLKKVIAYSTCSQLGYMVLACGVAAYNVSLYHLINHAFFKALLFLSAGCVIHSMSNEQDMRKMGALRSLLPISYIMILIGSLSLMGFPFLTGFYSKDAILEVVYAHQSSYSSFGYCLGVATAMITSFYSLRLIYLTFLTSKPFGAKKIYEACHESGPFMLISLTVLGLFSIFAGYLIKDLFIGLGSPVWFNSFGSFHHADVDLFVAEFIPSFLKMLPVYLSITVSVLFYFYYASVFRTEKLAFLPLYAYEVGSGVARSFLKLFHYIYSFFIKKWYFDLVYNRFVSFGVLNLSYTVFKKVDRGLFEYMGPTGVINYLYGLRNFVANLQSGPIYVYLTHMVLGLSFLIYFYLFPASIAYEEFFTLSILLYCVTSLLVSKVVNTSSMELAQVKTINKDIKLSSHVS